MAGSSLLVLIDDIAAVLDDASVIEHDPGLAVRKAAPLNHSRPRCRSTVVEARHDAAATGREWLQDHIRVIRPPPPLVPQ